MSGEFHITGSTEDMTVVELGTGKEVDRPDIGATALEAFGQAIEKAGGTLEVSDSEGNVIQFPRRPE